MNVMKMKHESIIISEILDGVDRDAARDWLDRAGQSTENP